MRRRKFAAYHRKFSHTMISPDCFAADHRLMGLTEAFALINERVAAVTGDETLPLDLCLGRILAEELLAAQSQPPFANAAMDGYGLRHEDLARVGRRLPIAARIAAGHPNALEIPSDCVVQIFTGAPLPVGFDTVVMQEDCLIEGNHVVFPDSVTLGSHVRLPGIDFKPGDRLLAAGQRLRPQDLAIAAAVGRSQLLVKTRLKIGLFSTGDELVEPGQQLGPGQIYDSNRPMLRAALTAMGFDVADLGHLDDRLDGLVTAFALAGMDHDALVSTGGVSVGGEDHVRTAIQQLGQIHFWKLAMKPGKPLALGQIGRAAFLGLPGNPVSSLISLLVVGRIVLQRLAGASLDAVLPRLIPVPAALSLARADNRVNFLRGSLVEQSGQIVALPYFSQDSSLISSLVGSHGLIEVGPGTTAIAAGEAVGFIPYESLLR